MRAIKIALKRLFGRYPTIEHLEFCEWFLTGGYAHWYVTLRKERFTKDEIFDIVNQEWTRCWKMMYTWRTDWTREHFPHNKFPGLPDEPEQLFILLPPVDYVRENRLVTPIVYRR